MDTYTSVAFGIIAVLGVISSIFGWLWKYKGLYTVIGLFATRKFPPAKNFHKYAVLVPARNESAVIGNLVDSIRKQDYPSELVDIFVVADNCTDDTAEVARKYGAVCYERFDNDHRTKGYALQFLVECINRDYGIESYEGYFVFDADNLLKGDFISRMNDSFDAGEKIIVSYRNTKNFDDNWISASYGLHWLRTVRTEHRAKSVCRLASRIQGTGFLMANEIIKDGWSYTSLTEDRALSADAVVQGYRISFNNAAEFYDEQPVDIKTAMRQRIRWAKGHLQALIESGGKLFVNIFVLPKSCRKRPFFERLLIRFMSYDMLTTVFPLSLYTVLKRITVYLLRISLLIIAGRHFGAYFALTTGTLYWTARTYVTQMIIAAYVFISEHKRIKPIKWYKKVWFCITFPIFDLIGKLSLVIALFTKVEWKPIPHKAALSIDDISKS